MSERKRKKKDSLEEISAKEIIVQRCMVEF
jgi:hypothetical protein